MSYYDWESESRTFARNASGLGEEKATVLLEQAAAAAKAGDLKESARILEEIRATVVGNSLFQGWDNGIWCFTSIINFIRKMSPETNVPKEYQRFLDAIPSAKFGEEMTSKQKAFWYKSASAQVGGEIRMVSGSPSSGKSGCGKTAAMIAVIAIAGSLIAMICGHAR